MKIRTFKKKSRYSLSRTIKQFPWNLSKIVKFKRRIWSRIKFSKRFLTPKQTSALNTRLFTTYKNKTKKLFRRYFAPNLTDRQCRKLFRSNSRYKATFKKILKTEHRLDTLIFRLFMLPNIGVARDLIKKNYFLINGKALALPQLVLSLGDIVEPANKIAWQFLYNNMFGVIASLKKYFSRIFFKFSFPFIIKRRRFRLREFGKFKEKTLAHVTNRISTRITRRVLFFRYKKLKEALTSKTKPAKKYYFKDSKVQAVKNKRLKTYILKKVKCNFNFSELSAPIKNKFKTNKIMRFKNQRQQQYLLKQLISLSKTAIKKTFLKNKSLVLGNQRRNLRLLKTANSLNTKKARLKQKTNFNINFEDKGNYKKKTFGLEIYKGYRLETASALRPFLLRNNALHYNLNKPQNLKKQRHLKTLRVQAIRKTKLIFSQIIKKKKFLQGFIKKKKNAEFSFKEQKPFKFLNNLKAKKKAPLSAYKIKSKTITRRLNLNKKGLQSQPLKGPKNKFKAAFVHNKNLLKQIKNLQFFNLFFYKKTRVLKISKTYKKNLPLFEKIGGVYGNRNKIQIKLPRTKLFIKKGWRKFIPKQPKNFWQFNRITKKHIFIFRYLKKFNNNYKQFRYFQNIKQISWKPYKTSPFWQKTNFLFEKKRKKLLSTFYKSVTLLCNKVKTRFLLKTYLKKKNKSIINLKTGLAKVKMSAQTEKRILKIKRKYLRLKGFYRKYKNLKIKVEFNGSDRDSFYSPIQIKYKKINLFFKHRPIAYYFAEMNYKSLEFTLINDVDFLFFPYRTSLDFKMLSFIY